PVPLIVVSSLFSCCADHRDLHSFPTRRSSDLGACRCGMITKSNWKVRLLISATLVAVLPVLLPPPVSCRALPANITGHIWISPEIGRAHVAKTKALLAGRCQC